MGTGGGHCRNPFVKRFRVVVRRYLYFLRGVSEDLGPTYMGCPVECTAPNADKRNGCPNCLYQIRYKNFEKKCQELFKKLEGYKRQDDFDWPIPRLTEYMTDAMRAAGQTRRGHARNWNVILGRLVDIYRDESNRMSSIDSWNHRQQMKTLLEQLRSEGHAGDSDEYEGES
jgi:hypothetical protein